MPLQLFILRRFLLTIPLLIGITLFSFIIANAVPSDPINANLPQNALNNEQMIAAFRKKWGLDKPPHEQYLTYLGNLLRGDLGVSIKTRNPVVQDIRQFLPATIELGTFSIMAGLVLGVGTGIISAVWRNSLIDYVLRTYVVIGVSFPVFVLALLGLTVLHVQLGLVAGPGRLDFILRDPPAVTGLFTVDAALAGEWGKFRNALSHLVLPAFTLGSFVAGIIARITRSSMLEVLGMDYIRTARAQGRSGTPGRAAPWPFQRHDSDRHRDRAFSRQPADRHCAGRVDFRLARHRPVRLSRRHFHGLPGNHGRQHSHRFHLCIGEFSCRHPLLLPRSPYPHRLSGSVRCAGICAGTHWCWWGRLWCFSG